MRTKMKIAEYEDKLLCDLLDIIRFTDGVSAKLHRVLNEAKIYQVVKDEFAKSSLYTAGILLLTDDGVSLRLAETSVASSRLRVLERASGLQAKGYKVSLDQSSIYRQVVREGKTVQASVSDIISEFLPRPLAYLISKIMNYEKKFSILTPLHRQGKVIGVLAVSCSDLCEYLIHSVENLALHISTALELVHERTQRNRAVQALEGYHAHLKELVEERTTELKTVNEKLLGEIAERKQAEEQLREGEQYLKTLFNASAGGILVIEPETHKIVDANSTVIKMIGLREDQIIGHVCHRFVCPAEEGKCPITDLKQRVDTSERILLKANSEEMPVLKSVVPITRHGRGYLLELVVDITEHRQAEEALQAEKNKLQSVVGAMEDGFTIQDKDYNIIYQNELLKRIFGDHPGEKCYRAYEGREKVCDGCPAEKAFRDGKSHASERRVVLPSGEVTFWENTASPVRDAGGRIFSCLEINRNITERKQAEETLQAEKNKLQSVIGAMESGLSIQDKDYNIIYQNEPVKRIFGDHPGEKCYRAYEGREKVCEGCPIEKAFRDGKSHASERKVVVPSGEVTFWEVRANPIRDAKGDIVSCLEVARDITERKQAEEALADEATRRRILVDQSRDGIVILDQNGKVYEANQRFAEMLGYSPKEVAQLHAWDWDTQWTREQLLGMIQSVDAAGDHFQTYHRRKDGTVYDVEISTNGAVCAGQKLVFCVCRDITERKQSEEALQAEKNKLQSVMGAMEDGLSIQDKDYNIIYQNEPSRIAAGGNYVGEKCYRAYEGREEVCEGCPVGKAFRNGKSHTAERRRVTPSGEVTFWENTANPIRDAKGRIISCLELTRNITERKQVEEALRESEERFRSIVENSQAGIMILDDAYQLIYVNPQICRMSGYSRKGLIGQDFRKFLDEESKQLVADRYIQRQRGEEVPPRYEFNIVRKDGQKRRVEISSAVIKDSAGKVRTVVQLLDITERKQAEEALRESKEQLRKMFESVTDGISVVDLSGIITEVNQRAVEIHGFGSKDKLLGRNALELVAPRDHERIATNMRKTLKQGTIRDVEYTLLKADGTEFPGELSTSVLRDASGKGVGHITIVRDVTERKRAEEALQAEKNKLQSVIDAMADGLTIRDTDYNLIYQSEPSKKLSGDHLGEKCYRVFEGRESVCEGCPVGKAFKDGKSHVAERKMVVPSGEVTFWENTASLVRDAEGRIVSCIEVGRDITERKRAEEKEKQLQQELYLSRRLASVGELAAGVAHEINNPLTGVLGFSQRLLRKSSDEEVRRDLEIIYGEAQRAAKVVQNLLTFARRREPKKEHSNINDIVQKTLELRAYELKTGNIEVVTDLIPRLPEIMVDFHQIQEVFLNIVLNAEQAMNEAHGEGKLIIKTREIKDYVRISFADNGPGIPPEQLDKVFDPFFTTRAEKGGTGLGLSACHGVVTEHGGRIYARSKPGNGATFFVELPLSRVKAAVGRRS
jgi:PAS domain S-box-containing protein